MSKYLASAVTGCYNRLLRDRFTIIYNNCQEEKVNSSSKVFIIDGGYMKENLVLQVKCRDCVQECQTEFHVIGLKCVNCGSYNTVRCGNEEIPEDEGGEGEGEGEGEGARPRQVLQEMLRMIREMRQRYRQMAEAVERGEEGNAGEEEEEEEEEENEADEHESTDEEFADER